MTALATPEARPTAGALRLDPDGNQVPKPTPDLLYPLVVRAHRCNSWFCETCGRKRADLVRANMQAELLSWEAFGLLTLTVDREAFPSPEECYAQVAKERRLGKYLNDLRELAKQHGFRIGRWISVLEFQGKSGTGWPHWHLLLEVSNPWLPKAFLRDCLWLWRTRYHVGGCDWKPEKVRTSHRAVRYVTKYLTKGVTPPPWVLRRTSAQAIKVLQGSRSCPSKGIPGVRPLIGRASTGAAEEDPEGTTRPPRAVRATTNEDRLEACGQRLRFFERCIDPLDGAVEREDFLDEFAGSIEDLAVLCEPYGGLVELERGVYHVPHAAIRKLLPFHAELRRKLARQRIERAPRRRNMLREAWGHWQGRKRREITRREVAEEKPAPLNGQCQSDLPQGWPPGPLGVEVVPNAAP